ncbi:MAG: cytochrome c biogenesis protein ResB [Desulfobacterales bacterium]|nr:cytochrome c biogenesis protein ResB [Desulfobacterales bacterium]
MNQKEVSANFLNRILKVFASVRLTIVLLLSLAVTSIIGTLIPQNESPVAYFREYGESLYRIFDALQIFDMYHSWWFQFLLLMLTINILVCSIDRLSMTWKSIFVKIPSFNLSRFRNVSEREEYNTNHEPEYFRKTYAHEVSKGFSYSRIEETDKGFCIFAEKGRWTRLGVYSVHFSVILLLLGGLIGSIFGFTGSISIPEGEKTNSIRLKNTGKLQKLDFEIQCDDFNVTFYDSKAPKEYRSSLTILEEGKPVLKKEIIVNDPLRYKGINIFQASYGMSKPKEITIGLKSQETGMEYEEKIAFEREIDLPEGMGKFIINDYNESYHFRGQHIGEAFIGKLIKNDGDKIDIILPIRYPNFDKMRRGKLTITVKDYERTYFTGLQVTKDPGVYVVYAGFIVMIIGCYITFFMSHQRLCVEVMKSGKKSKVMVAGTATKNKIGLQNKIKKIAKSLKALV